MSRPPAAAAAPTEALTDPSTQGEATARLAAESRGDEVTGPGRMITWRAVVLGLVLSGGMAALVPYNDFVVYNTLVVGTYFPMAVVISIFVLVLLVNAPLLAWAPRWAFSGGELAVILAMLMAACAVPAQGLMRALLPTMVSPFYFAQTDPAFAKVFEGAGVWPWLFPSNFAGSAMGRVVNEFYGRTPAGQVPPYFAWVVPIGVWCIPVGAMFVILLSMSSLLRAQWMQNERLAFPIAQLTASLIAPPEKGRWVNELLGRRSFWVAAGGVLAIHLVNGLHTYLPRYFVEIPLTYDLSRVVATPPASYLNWAFKTSTIYFTVVGVMYFIPGRIGLSLWLCTVTLQMVSFVGEATFGQPITREAANDQHLGAAMAFLMGTVWVGRRHWATVTRHVFVGRGRYETVSYRLPAVALGVGMVVFVAWYVVAGAGVGTALSILGMLMLSHLVVARIVCETGVPVFRTVLAPLQVLSNLPAGWFTSRDVFLGSAGMIVTGSFGTRDSLVVHSLHGQRLLEDYQPTPRQRRNVMLLMGAAIAVAFAASAVSGLYCYYHYATPIASRVAQPVINDHLLLVMPRAEIVDPMVKHAQGSFTAKAHDPWLHMGVGFGVMWLLQGASWFSGAWPIAPVGWLAGTAWYMLIIWWSVLLGWLAKLLVVHFGGAPLYRNARPFFVGLIFGESLAAVVWFAVSLVMALTGRDYFDIRFLPT